MMQSKQELQKQDRKGAAVAELAICLPAIVLLVMGAIECCSMIFLRQSLHITAYEGVRVAIKENTDSTQVWNRCQRVLSERGINDSAIVISPAETEFQARGTPISVQVTAPCSSNNALPLQFFGSQQMSATATMVKE